MNVVVNGRKMAGVEACPCCLRPLDAKVGMPDLVVGDLAVSMERREASWRGSPVPLTELECRILYGFASMPGAVRSRQNILDVGWGIGSDVEERNADCHVKRLRRKFEKVDESFSQIEAVYGTGYRWRKP